MQNETKKPQKGIKLIKCRVVFNDKIEEEEIVEIVFPLERDAIPELNNKVKKALEK